MHRHFADSLVMAGTCDNKFLGKYRIFLCFILKEDHSLSWKEANEG